MRSVAMGVALVVLLMVELGAQSSDYQIHPTWLSMRVNDSAHTAAVRRIAPFDTVVGVTWMAQDTSIAQFSPDGVLRAKSPGTTTITADWQGVHLCQIVNVLTTDPAPRVGDTTTVKVCIVLYDPLIPSKGKLLSELMGWHDHEALTQQVISTFHRASRGAVRIQVVKTIPGDLSIVRKNGVGATAEDVYSFFMNGGLGKPIEWSFSYKEFIEVHGLCEMRNNGEIDEVWTWVFPGMFQMWESTLAGPNAFWYNSSPVQNTSCLSLLPIMALNFERTYDLALHSFGHRMESTMQELYNGWDARRVPGTPWDQFTAFRHLTGNRSAVGNIHYPPNAVSDYDYGNSSSVTTSADVWMSWPYPIGQSRTITCQEWGCSQEGYMEWWWDHIPEATGVTGSVLNNWWPYLFAYEKARSLIGYSTVNKDVSEPVTWIDRSPDVDTVCLGETVTLTASKGYASYRWSNGLQGRSIVVRQSGTYTVTCQLATCSGLKSTATSSRKVTFKPRRQRPDLADTCGVLTATGVGPFAWYRDGSRQAGESGPSIVVKQSGVYTVKQDFTSAECASLESEPVSSAPNKPPYFSRLSVRDTIRLIDRTDSLHMVRLEFTDECPEGLEHIVRDLSGDQVSNPEVIRDASAYNVMFRIDSLTTSPYQATITVADRYAASFERVIPVRFIIVRDTTTDIPNDDGSTASVTYVEIGHDGRITIHSTEVIDLHTVQVTDLLGRSMKIESEAGVDPTAAHVRLFAPPGVYVVSVATQSGAPWSGVIRKSQ